MTPPRTIVCRCCGRRVVWAIVWHENVELGGREGGRWMLADEAIRSPWQPAPAPHPVDPVRE